MSLVMEQLEQTQLLGSRASACLRDSSSYQEVNASTWYPSDPSDWPPPVTDITKKTVDYYHRNLIISTRKDRWIPISTMVSQEGLSRGKSNVIQSCNVNIGIWFLCVSLGLVYVSTLVLFDGWTLLVSPPRYVPRSLNYLSIETNAEYIADTEYTVVFRPVSRFPLVRARRKLVNPPLRTSQFNESSIILSGSTMKRSRWMIALIQSIICVVLVNAGCPMRPTNEQTSAQRTPGDGGYRIIVSGRNEKYVPNTIYVIRLGGNNEKILKYFQVKYLGA